MKNISGILSNSVLTLFFVSRLTVVKDVAKFKI